MVTSVPDVGGETSDGEESSYTVATNHTTMAAEKVTRAQRRKPHTPRSTRVIALSITASTVSLERSRVCEEMIPNPLDRTIVVPTLSNFCERHGTGRFKADADFNHYFTPHHRFDGSR